MHKSLSFSIVALLLAACSDSKSSASAQTTSGPLASHLLAAAPADAKSVLDLRASGKNGEDVVVRGRAKDFVKGMAAFTLIDSSLKACDEGGPMPSCETPWDFCCDPIEEITKASATVEVRDASGVIKQDAQGFAGLDHLDTVVASGKLERDDKGNLTLVAKNFYVEKRHKP